MKDLQRKLLATFQTEHRDHVSHIRSLLALMATTGALAAGPEFEEIFRRAHSLKGAARAVEVQPVEQLAHRLETLFSRVRQGACAFDEQVDRVTQQVLDASEDCMAALAGPSRDARPDTIAAALKAIGGVLGMADSPGDEAEAVAVATEASSLPESAGGFHPLEMLRISAENFDGLFRTAGGIAGEAQRQDQVARELEELVRNISRIEKASRMALLEQSQTGQRDGFEGARPAAAAGLASVLESVQATKRQAYNTRRLHRRSQWSLRQLGAQLQDDVRQARLAPAESLLDGYRRMMRDLARDEGKQIRFHATCGSVHADRRVLDAIKDPIMHLLRNAVSHGIESAAVRLQKGKKPEGLVTLRIEAEGQMLSVALEDDGGGVDFARVAEVAAREGIRSGAENSHLSAMEDLTRILFRAGFSTSRAVTTLSGRGMGLSVVYEAARRLQGEVNLQPVPGGGTRIELSVPLSIASHKLMIVNSGKHVFAIPLPGIERLRPMERSKVETVAGKPVLLLDGEPTPLASLKHLLDLEDLLDLEPVPDRNDTPEKHILILRSGAQRIALGVDAIVREADAMIQEVPYAALCGGRVSSAAVLEDGGIALVLNLTELIQSALRPGASRSRPRPQPASVPESPRAAVEAPATILIVDDSMTTRALEKSILEAHGYKVRVAVDGIEALTRLRHETVDLVISDIEMPRLDGFGLIEAMKQDAGLRKIPVIVVSSVERREDKERGLAVGADAYIVKRKFDQEELLGVIRQIL